MKSPRSSTSSTLPLHLVVILLLSTFNTKVNANRIKTTTTTATSAPDTIDKMLLHQQQPPQQRFTTATRTRGAVRFNFTDVDAVFTTTTSQPPSLRAPHRRPHVTLPMTTATPTTPKATETAATATVTVGVYRRRERQQKLRQQLEEAPAARQTTTIAMQTRSLDKHASSSSSSSSSNVAAAVVAAAAAATTTTARVQLSSTTPPPPPPQTPSPSPSQQPTQRLHLRERAARDINDEIGNGFGVRQNRSFQTQTALLMQRSDENHVDDESNARAENDDIAGVSHHHHHQHQHQREYKRLERRQPFKANTNDSANLASSSSSLYVERLQEASSAMNPFRQHFAVNDKSGTKPLQTLKTPRMIQRLVAGHIQNSQGHSTYEVSSVTSNSSVSSSYSTSTPSTTTTTFDNLGTEAREKLTSTTTTPKIPTTAYNFRRKPSILSSSYRNGKGAAKPVSAGTTSSTTHRTTLPLEVTASLQHHDDNDNDADDHDHDDDEALLDDPNDFDNWDNGILRLSAGSGKENLPLKSKKNKEDSKKTLSDQVRDGKYGLIEKELFRREPKRPGVLSYLPNKEVPDDNDNNFGGLNEEDIWLAEDHLLVIKGGSLNDGADGVDTEPWPPIDDYDAPGRQIKIPAKPKVPPPFPVQLEENGPVQFIGNSKFTVVYPVANESVSVYTAGTKANHASPTSDSDNEKNSVARPGSSQDLTDAGPGYFYPAPYPPWLYHNQTFVNPYLKQARPITFPGLGPFSFGRNGSLDNNNSNATEDFDEDDPSLYYPPAYSFVYKSNYTNAVPPGPLVPGIVLPPPPDQFSRLEKHEKLTPPTSVVTQRQRIHTSHVKTSTNSLNVSPVYTTTTTTSTTSTTPIPFRQVITKISEYKPKVITITPSPPASISTSPLPKSTAGSFEPVPVPVAVPIPIYPINYSKTARPNIVSFVPTTAGPTTDTLSQSNPIYYEYFEAKRQSGYKSNIIDDFLSTTVKPPPSPKPIKLYATSKRPFKSQQQHQQQHQQQQHQQQQHQQQQQQQRNYLQPVAAVAALPGQHQFTADNIVYITPKPPPQAPVFKPRPLENFEREVNALRETLRYYKNQQLRDNSIPRTPKAKTIYEYSFDATKNIQPATAALETSNFQPPEEFDEEPFKPMVTYSPAVNDENSFKAIAFDKADNEVATPAQITQTALPNREQVANKYQTTTTLIPVQPEAQYRPVSGERSKKLRVGAKYLQQTLITPYDHAVNGYGTTPRTTITTQLPWVSLDAKELVQQQQHQQQQQQQREQQHQQQQQFAHSERLQVQPIIGIKNRNFHGYYYRQPLQPPSRQNTRFYDEPFHNPVRKIINYRLQQQPNPVQQQQQTPQQWNLENDTYVNYAPNRPPLNPDAEFISPYHTLPVNVYGPQTQRGPPPPALSHQSQYYAPPQRYPVRQLQPQQPQQQQTPQIPLHHDIHVNYRPPLPPINPESEYISHPHVVRNQPNHIYRTNSYRLASPSAAGDASNIYYIAPKYRRSSGSTVNGAITSKSNSGNSGIANNEDYSRV